MRTRRGTGDHPPGALAFPARPDGAVVWFDADDAESAGRLAALGRRIRAEGGRFLPVITAPPVEAEGATVLPPVAESAAALSAFLAHWRPAAIVRAGALLRPGLVAAAAAAGVPVVLLEAGPPTVPGGGRWPRLIRQTLAQIHTIHARDDAAGEALLRAGAPPDRLAVTGPIETPPRPLAANEPERAAIARAIGTRPVWLATAVTEAELDAIAAAHLAALRGTHRLLLIAVPEPVAAAERMAERLAAVHGLTVGRRAEEAEIDDDINVYLADTEGEYGLWYRLAPRCYLGGTLTPQGSLRHPYEAAALGSAIIHGPQWGVAADAFAALVKAGATLPVASGAELGDAVATLLAPERAAACAHAAWAQATVGAGAMARAVQAILPLVARAGP
jgi:3-deoxy-D-manno-octulosonic-acid transferase